LNKIIENKEEKMKKKADYFGLSLCDLGSAVFNMGRIMEAEEMQMHA